MTEGVGTLLRKEDHLNYGLLYIIIFLGQVFSRPLYV